MVTPRNVFAFIIIHPQISKWETAKIILVSPTSILVGEWLQRQQHFWAWSLYVLSKCNVRHRLHYLVLTDTYFINFTKEKNLLCKSKMAPYYVFATLMLWRRLLPLYKTAKEYIYRNILYWNLFPRFNKITIKSKLEVCKNFRVPTKIQKHIPWFFCAFPWSTM